MQQTNSYKLLFSLYYSILMCGAIILLLYDDVLHMFII